MRVDGTWVDPQLLAIRPLLGGGGGVTFLAPERGLCAPAGDTHMLCGLAPGGPIPPVVGDPQAAGPAGTAIDFSCCACGAMSAAPLLSLGALDGLAPPASEDVIAGPESPYLSGR